MVSSSDILKEESHSTQRKPSVTRCDSDLYSSNTFLSQVMLELMNRKPPLKLMRYSQTKIYVHWKYLLQPSLSKTTKRRQKKVYFCVMSTDDNETMCRQLHGAPDVIITKRDDITLCYCNNMSAIPLGMTCQNKKRKHEILCDKKNK